jgi:hypothetical protein
MKRTIQLMIILCSLIVTISIGSCSNGKPLEKPTETTIPTDDFSTETELTETTLPTDDFSTETEPTTIPTETPVEINVDDFGANQTATLFRQRWQRYKVERRCYSLQG